jgi:hypothetical protein
MLLMTMKKAIMQMIGKVEKTVKVPKIEDVATREAGTRRQLWWWQERQA